jgi:hypothetical protein
MDWLIFGSINLIVVVGLFLFLSRRLHQQYNSQRFLEEVQTEVNTIITELNQTTERNLQLIEERMEKLNTLILQVDRRILLAKTEEERRNESSGTYSQLQGKQRQIQREMARSVPVEARVPFAVAPPVEADLFTPEPARPATPETTVAAIQPTVPEVTVAVDSVKIRHVQGRDAMKAQVFDMSQAGIAPTLIAQHFGISLGEVELIISLQSGRSS